MSPATEPVMRPAKKDYGYCNARVRGMWSHLVGVDQLELLVLAPDIDSQIRVLSGTPYKAELEDALLQGHTPASIDVALRANLDHSTSKVLRLLPKDGLAMVRALLSRWDVFDIKTVIRGVHAHSSPADIMASMFPAATLSEAELGELSRANDVAGVVDTLATWQMAYAKPLDEAMSQYRERKETAPLELALDCWNFTQVKQQLKRGRGRDRVIVRRIFGVMVDIENLRTMLRLAGADLSAEATAGYWLPGGSALDLETFQRGGAAVDVDAALNAIGKTPYSKVLDEAAMNYARSGRLSSLERSLEDLVTREIIGLKSVDPLSIGIVVAFLWAKQNEVTNIRIAVTGRAVGLPEDRLRRELILV